MPSKLNSDEILVNVKIKNNKMMKILVKVILCKRK